MKKKIIVGIIIILVILLLLLLLFGTRKKYVVEDTNKLDVQTRKNIVSGDEKNVPPEIRHKVKEEYLESCNKLTDNEKRIECLEIYYDGQNVIDIKKSCKTKTVQQEKDDCMDSYYIAQAQASSDKVFCESIKDENEREDCFAYI